MNLLVTNAAGFINGAVYRRRFKCNDYESYHLLSAGNVVISNQQENDKIAMSGIFR